jgi:SAM-dependent methyltransferase
MSRYVLRGGEAGAVRLRLLARVMWPQTEPLLQRAGLREGLRVLDIGCGIGEVSVKLAERVGPGGAVVGIDIDGTALEVGRREVERRGLAVRFRRASVLEYDEESTYDLVFCRFVLSHLPDPEKALTGLVRALRPGGVLVVEDTDFAGTFRYPDCPALDRYRGWYQTVVKRNGGDSCIGPRLLGMLLDAGVEDVRLGVVLPTFRDGEGKTLAAVTLDHIRETVLVAGLASPEELDATAAEIDAFTRDDRTILSLPRIFQLWGRWPTGKN